MLQVTEAGKGSLPSWLHFAPGLNVLKGIPTPADAGQLYLEVVAHGHDGQKAADVFSVFITADTPAMSSGQPLKFKSSGPEMVRCKREEPETVATIVVDADIDRMAVDERLGLLSRFLSHMGLMEEMVKMVPAKAKLLQDDTALVTGSGDATEPRFPGLSVSWLVGCGKVRAVWLRPSFSRFLYPCSVRPSLPLLSLLSLLWLFCPPLLFPFWLRPPPPFSFPSLSSLAASFLHSLSLSISLSASSLAASFLLSHELSQLRQVSRHPP